MLVAKKRLRRAFRRLVLNKEKATGDFSFRSNAAIMTFFPRMHIGLKDYFASFWICIYLLHLEMYFRPFASANKNPEHREVQGSVIRRRVNRFLSAIELFDRASPPAQPASNAGDLPIGAALAKACDPTGFEPTAR